MNKTFPCNLVTKIFVYVVVQETEYWNCFLWGLQDRKVRYMAFNTSEQPPKCWYALIRLHSVVTQQTRNQSSRP